MMNNYCRIFHQKLFKIKVVVLDGYHHRIERINLCCRGLGNDVGVRYKKMSFWSGGYRAES